MGEVIPFPSRLVERPEAHCATCGSRFALVAGADLVTSAAMTCPCGGALTAKSEEDS